MADHGVEDRRGIRLLRPRHLPYAGLVLVPVDFALQFTGVGNVVLFCVSVAALIPLAFLIGEATDHASEHLGPGIAGLLNASFGNAPELIIALFSVHRGLFDVVRGTLTGSIVSNLLLVMGMSAIFGRRGRIQRRSCAAWLGLVLFGLVLLIGPAQQYWGSHSHPPAPMTAWAIVVCAVLAATYAVVTIVSVLRQRRAHQEQRAESEEAEDPGGWSLPVSLIVLGLVTLGTVAVSEVLTESIQDFAVQVGWSQFFVAAVLVALAGNATEHGGAVILAFRGKLALSAEIAFSSSAQVATMVIPAIALLSLAFNPLPLAFRPAEIIAIAVAVLVPGAMLLSRRVSQWWGVALCGTYLVIAVAFFII